jgi:hypothetical protein
MADTVAAESPRRFPWLAFVIVVLFSHLVATGILLVANFGRTMARFDTGAPATVVDQICDMAFKVLSFPAVPLLLALNLRADGLLGWGVFCLNSALWTLAACGIVVLVRRRAGRATASPYSA